MDFSHIVSALGGVVVGAGCAALIYRNNIAKVTALLGAMVAHVLAGTAEEEAKIVPEIKAFLAAHLHL